MSTGSFLGRAAHAEWDSGQVGYIYMDKDRAFHELAGPPDILQITGAIKEKSDTKIHIQPGKSETLSHAASARGFFHVESKDLCFSDTSVSDLSPQWLDQESLYKKGSTLYILEEGEEQGVFHPRAVASVKQTYQNLTEHNWLDIAKEVLHAEVLEYDNYLTDEVYLIRCFDGFDEVSVRGDCYPGKSILTHCFDNLLDGWCPELAEQFHHYDTLNFQIEDYLEETEFPEYRKALNRAVAAVLEDVTEPYPFSLSKAQILENQNNSLDDIVDQLYQTHTMPSPSEVIRQIADTVGVSREALPRLSSADLVPGKDYTAEELKQLLQKKTVSFGRSHHCRIRKNKGISDHGKGNILLSVRTLITVKNILNNS